MRVSVDRKHRALVLLVLSLFTAGCVAISAPSSFTSSLSHLEVIGSPGKIDCRLRDV